VTAAQTIGLHICGVDVVCESVLRPLEDQGGGVVEVESRGEAGGVPLEKQGPIQADVVRGGPGLGA